jgi:hypothetical protein
MYPWSIVRRGSCCFGAFVRNWFGERLTLQPQGEVMALDRNKLVTALRRFMDPSDPDFAWPISRPAAVQLWTDAYDSYASDAVDYSGDGVSSKSPAGFEAALVSQFSGSWTASAAAIAFRNAFIAYWTGGVFSVGSVPPPGGACPNVGGNGVFSIESSSVVSSVGGTTLRTQLQAVFNDLTDDAEAKIQDIATVFHEATTQHVIVLISGLDTTPPPAGPLPITNTCKVF